VVPALEKQFRWCIDELHEWKDHVEAHDEVVAARELRYETAQEHDDALDRMIPPYVSTAVWNELSMIMLDDT